jgi:hypothetical protein
LPATLGNPKLIDLQSAERKYLKATAGLTWKIGDFLRIDPSTGLAVQSLAVNTNNGAADQATGANLVNVRMDYDQPTAMLAGAEFSGLKVKENDTFRVLLTNVDATIAWNQNLTADQVVLRRTTNGEAYVANTAVGLNGMVILSEVNPATVGETFVEVLVKIRPEFIQR